MRFKIFIAILFLSSCKKKEGFENIRVIGHAAMGLDILNSVYHDNSKEAVEFALSIEGCDGVEMDLQLSKDGKLWLYHDTKLENETNGNGCVNNLNSSELSTLYYKTLAKEKLVALSDIDFSLFKGKELFLDFRHLNFCESSYINVAAVISQLQDLNLVSQINFTVNCILGYDAWIEPFTDLGMNVYYSIYTISELNNLNNVYPAIKGYIVKNNDFSKSDVDQIKSNNKKVYIFEIRSPKGIRKALNKFPHGVITDDLRTTLIEKY
jgi:glycerophosphoryl diester phosphodiesterase